MSTSDARHPWLCIEPFLADFTGARALSSAFELGLVDLLADGAMNAQLLRERIRLDERGSQVLLAMLAAYDVVENEDDAVRFTEPFLRALAFRDLLEARLYFAHLVAPDFLQLSTALFAQPEKFFQNARLFQLFSYDRCFERTRENLESTARWMRVTTMLTRYESQACIEAFDFSRYRRQLDVGGNSGEFLLQACRAQPGLSGTVYDLPLVCEIGSGHVAGEPEAGRIEFVPARDRTEPLPAGHDLISFKSMLHDWPDAHMHAFLARAHQALEQGGGILIFERAWSESPARPLSYGQLPLLLFFRSYRKPDDYRIALADAGFEDIEMKEVMLDSPFILITARKGGRHVSA